MTRSGLRDLATCHPDAGAVPCDLVDMTEVSTPGHFYVKGRVFSDRVSLKLLNRFQNFDCIRSAIKIRELDCKQILNFFFCFFGLKIERPVIPGFLTNFRFP